MKYFLVELLPVVGIGLFIALILGVFFLMIVLAHNRLEIEKGKTPLYTSTAGGRIGWTSYRGPFISLRIYDEFIVIGYVKTIVLKFEEIERVEIKKWMGIVSDKVQIIHHKLDAPDTIIIGTTNPSQVKEIIDSKLEKRM